MIDAPAFFRYHQGAGAVRAEFGLGQNVRSTVSAFRISGQSDVLICFEFAGQGSCADFFDPAGVLHEITCINRCGVADLAVADEERLIAEQSDRQFGADIAPSSDDMSAFYQLTGVMRISSSSSFSCSSMNETFLNSGCKNKVFFPTFGA